MPESEGEIDAEAFEAYEDKLDELNEGLLEAYAAGFAKAKEVYDITKGWKDVQALMETEGVSEGHYYYWDGRTKPLAPWLREQYDIGDESEHTIELIHCGGCERHSLLADAKESGEWEGVGPADPHCPRCGTLIDCEDTAVETFERRQRDDE